ncbi:MAG: hypothetical protein K2H56_02660 [Malacoplasma sp.]|nr:hypothetical protein [Malacoplasma sp.]
MDYKEKVSQGINKASTIFSNCYKSFDEKIEFLKKVHEDSQYPYTCEHKDEILEAVQILGDNAKDADPRKQQQAYLAELVKKFMSNDSKEELIFYFKNNEILFNIFCLMYVHFNKKDASEKEKQAHAFLLGPLFKTVEKIIS